MPFAVRRTGRLRDSAARSVVGGADGIPPFRPPSHALLEVLVTHRHHHFRVGGVVW